MFKQDLVFSLMVLETRFQSQFESYQRLKKIVLDTFLLNTQHLRYVLSGAIQGKE